MRQSWVSVEIPANSMEFRAKFLAAELTLKHTTVVLSVVTVARCLENP
jgi:hypothetical protein